MPFAIGLPLGRLALQRERFKACSSAASLWACAALLFIWSLLSFTRFYAAAFYPVFAFTGPAQLLWVRGTLLALAALSATAALSPRTRVFLTSSVSVAALPFVAVLFVAAYRSRFGAFDSLYAILIFEDGPVEFSTFAFFAASATAMAMAAIDARHIASLGFVLLALFLGFVAGEEISWGQRLFHWATPDMLAAVNLQQETNLHNIAGLEWVARHIGPFLVGAYGALGWLPGCVLNRAAEGRYRWLAPFALFFPPARVVGYFLPLAVFSVVKFHQPETFWFALRDEELWEFFVATGFLIYAVDCRRGMRRADGAQRHVHLAREARDVDGGDPSEASRDRAQFRVTTQLPPTAR